MHNCLTARVSTVYSICTLDLILPNEGKQKGKSYKY